MKWTLVPVGPPEHSSAITWLFPYYLATIPTVLKTNFLGLYWICACSCQGVQFAITFENIFAVEKKVMTNLSKSWKY
jgi:hypothetical protein